MKKIYFLLAERLVLVLSGQCKTIIILCVIGAILFAIQLLFCFFAKRAVIRLVPVYVLVFCGLFAAALSGDGGFGADIMAYILTMGIGAALAGDLTAWAAYAVYRKKR